MANELIYELKNVSYSYLGRFLAVKGINLTVKNGERIALLGANGSGKSTLLLILAGLIFPDGGAVKFSGEELSEDNFANAPFQKKFRNRVGIVFQNSDIQLFNSNVEEEILFGLMQLGLSKEECSRRLKEYMALMDIENLKDRHPQNLSIGEKKRVAIASVLAMEPGIILLDEPTSGLDPRTSRHLIDAICAFAQKGCTTITSTQDIHIVSEIADRVIVMGEGRNIARDGSAEEVLQDSAFLEQHNLVHVHKHKHKDVAHVHSHQHPAHDHPHTV